MSEQSFPQENPEIMPPNVLLMSIITAWQGMDPAKYNELVISKDLDERDYYWLVSAGTRAREFNVVLDSSDVGGAIIFWNEGGHETPYGIEQLSVIITEPENENHNSRRSARGGPVAATIIGILNSGKLTAMDWEGNFPYKGDGFGLVEREPDDRDLRRIHELLIKVSVDEIVQPTYLGGIVTMWGTFGEEPWDYINRN